MYTGSMQALQMERSASVAHWIRQSASGHSLPGFKSQYFHAFLEFHSGKVGSLLMAIGFSWVLLPPHFSWVFIPPCFFLCAYTSTFFLGVIPPCFSCVFLPPQISMGASFSTFFLGASYLRYSPTWGLHS